METIQVTFSDGGEGRLAQEQPGGPVVCETADGSVQTAEEAGTLYLLQVMGDPEPPQIQGARDAGYVIEVQYGAALVLPPPPEPPPLRQTEEGGADLRSTPEPERSPGWDS